VTSFYFGKADLNFKLSDEITIGAHRSIATPAFHDDQVGLLVKHFSGDKKLPDVNIHCSHIVHTVTCTPIARQRVAKQVPAKTDY
jgi:hypothetical protein